MMTLEELLAREAIRKTMSTYTFAGDHLRINEFLSVFTEDAILETDGVPDADAFRCQGRSEIAVWINRWKKPPGGERKAHGATFVRHHLSTSQIELQKSDSAVARTYWVAWTDIGADHCGYYIDTFRNEADHWLISHRKIRLDWRSTDSLYMSAIAQTRG